ncbi:MAG TPA: hypothetical protein VFW23_00500 [Tepidisphaeraceae bacterium]|nr:hypothetical protein [Tepidisphaeraceae bacterium]
MNIDSVIPSDAGAFTIRVAYAGPDAGDGAAASATAIVTIDRLPASAIASPDAIYTVSPAELNVTAGTITFNTDLSDVGNAWQNATIDASGSAHLIFNSPQTLYTLNLCNSAAVTVSQGSGGSTGNVLQLTSLSMSTAATLDLGDNSMIVSANAATIQSLLTTGYNNGAWDGPGIDSSTAANDATGLTSLGWLDNSVGWLDSNNNLQHYSSFAGISLSGTNQILVRYTLAGDANLDGVVDGTDASQTSAGQNQQGAGWLYGDFNYDGTAGASDDFGILARAAQTPGQSIGDAQYAPAFDLKPLPLQLNWNTPFDGDIATFTDTANLPASDYTADVYWGDGSLSVAQVTATDTPGSFRINAISPIFTNANPIMLVTLQYAAGSGYQSEAALASQPIEVLQLPPGVNASADAVYSISGGPGNVQLNLTAGSLSFDANVSHDSNYFQNLSFTVTGSAHAYFNSPENFNALNIQNNAIVSVSKGGGGTHGNLLNVQSLSIDPNAKLDLADNALIDWYALSPDTAAETAAAAQMQSWLTSGYNGGAWNGPGIDSSVAADDLTRSTALGWLDNAFNYLSLSGLNPSYTTFEGVTFPTNNQLLVQFTYYGDANLDGTVDNSDLNLWHAGYLNSRSEWVYGNFNYDSTVDNTADLNAWDANYGLSTTAPNFARAFQPTGIVINPVEGVPFSGDIATFYDILNPSNTDASIYTAQVDWGDGHFVSAQVTATDTPGSFRINAVSPPLTDPNAVITVTIEYADMNDPSPTYQGRPAAVSEPITMTPAVSELTAAAASTSEIDLTWTLSAPNASAIEVDRSTDGNTWDTVTDSLAGNATSFADTSALNEATHYFYRVRLIWSSGPSAFTNIADAWTLANAPSALTKQVVSSNEIDLIWVNNSAATTAFQIERSDDGTNFYPLDTSDGTSYADTSAGDGSTYTYRVEALNGGQIPSAPSNAVSASTVLAPPSGLTATAVSASEIDLAWSDDSVTATGYEVDRSTDGVNFASLAPSLPADATSYSDIGLAPGSHFYYRVISLAAGQVSDPSNTADDTTVPPAPDSDWAGIATSSSVTINWDAAQGASGYEVDRSVNGSWVDVADITGGSTTTFTDTGLLANTTFSYQIIAKNNAGQSSPIGISATTSADTPAAPSNLQAIVLSPTSVELIWTNNADNEQGFRIDKSDDGGFTWTNLGSTGPGGAADSTRVTFGV